MYSLSYALRSGVCVVLKKLDQPSVQSSLSATTFYSILTDYPYPVSSGLRVTYVCCRMESPIGGPEICLVSTTQRQAKQIDLLLGSEPQVAIKKRPIHGLPESLFNLLAVSHAPVEYEPSVIDSLLRHGLKYEELIHKVVFGKTRLNKFADRQDLYYAIKYCRGLYEKTNTDSANQQAC